MECFAKEHLSGQTQRITYFLKTYFSTPDFKFDLYQNCFLPLRSLSLGVISLAKTWYEFLELQILDLKLTFEILEGFCSIAFHCNTGAPFLASLIYDEFLFDCRHHLSLPSPNPYQSWYSSIGSPYKEPVLYISDRKLNQLVSRNLPSGFQLDTFRGWGPLSDITWLDPLREAFPQQLLDDNLASASIYQIMLCSLFGCFLLSSSLRTNCSNFLLFWNLIFLLSSPIFWRNIILSFIWNCSVIWEMFFQVFFFFWYVNHLVITFF